MESAGRQMAAEVIAGEHRAIGRAISLCENTAESPEAASLIHELWPHTGQATTVGITGPPGAGKSTLVAGLVRHLREQEKTVGVLAIDPSSPYSDGAILGDRFRMHDHFLDAGVFIRSMSSRGHLGGIAEAAFLASLVLDAAGKDVVIVETVGVGQSEVEISSLVDSTVVVMQPGSGDSIQALKSGLMEIPDVLCLNKKDIEGADAAKQVLKGAVKNKALFVATSAVHNEGLDDLWKTVETHLSSLGTEGLREKRRNNLSHQLATIAVAKLLPKTKSFLKDSDEIVARLEAKALDPLQAVNQILATIQLSKT